ncbi:hypothetical protein PJI16_06515 [Nitrospira sp. MA-1]|nr:hypothetical protein [Nitrospira sp. MA-1]
MDRDAVSERENEKSERSKADIGIVGGVVGLNKEGLHHANEIV